MSKLIILKGANGAIAYLRPGRRKIFARFPGDVMGFDVEPARQPAPAESDTEWLDAVRAEAIDIIASGIETRPEGSPARSTLTIPSGGPTLAWLSHSAPEMSRAELLAVLALVEIDAEAEDAWLDRIHCETMAALERDGRVDLLAMERVADVPAEIIPTDETSLAYRDAWTWANDDPAIDIDMPKARELRIDRLRDERNARLDALDKQEMRTMEMPAELADVRAAKQALRDAPETFVPAVEAAGTLAELEAVVVP